MKNSLWGILIILLMVVSCSSGANQLGLLNKENTLNEPLVNNKFVFYQALVRHFGNTHTTNKYYGSIEENGVNKFNDFTATALQELYDLGITHMWYTGVIEHATMTDYSAYGIKPDDPDVVKGRAGSSYAIKDYYDVCPDFAVDVSRRMQEFEQLIERTHQHKMKVIIDFIPNHVARTYYSDRKPDNVKDFGVDDDKTKQFLPANDFYYIPDSDFHVPGGYILGGGEFYNVLKNGSFPESPAKATGNNVFSSSPAKDDWFETVKLNYGVDFQRNETKHFDPVPPLWFKMRDILLFWAGKGVDGFRCDMVEMVPVEFWAWVNDEVKKSHPDILFIGEAYNKQEYANFYTTGKFDFLYDKVGLYDTLKMLMRNDDYAGVRGIQDVWRNEVKGYSARMLRFLENHDEQRIASKDFAGDPFVAIPAMVLSATMATGPVMIYSGQEVGEPGIGHEGFGGEDGRTSIFDYWGVPQHQKWMNKGKFDGGLLAENEVRLRAFYKALFNIVKTEQSIQAGGFYDLMVTQQVQPDFPNRIYAYLRYTHNERLLVIANFEKAVQNFTLILPDDVIQAFHMEGKQLVFKDLLGQEAITVNKFSNQIDLKLEANQAQILKF